MAAMPSVPALLLVAVILVAAVAVPAAGAGYINPLNANRAACPPRGSCAAPGAPYTDRGCQRIYHDPEC